MTNDVSSIFYGDQDEIIMHFLRDCEPSREFWDPFIYEKYWARFLVKVFMIDFIETSLLRILVADLHWSTFFFLS